MNAAILVAALGYFVDVFDILLFSILRMPSLTSLGLTEAEAFSAGVRILNFQLIGLLIGGVIWGIWADKVGRLSVLYGSILLYSIANLACVFVQGPEMYAWYRGIAGFGLAGELGAGITLVSELMPAEKRGWGTTIITAVGLFGAVVAGILAEYIPWRDCYLIGAVLGFLLLFARVKVGEGEAFTAIKERKDLKKGNLFILFSTKSRFIKYISCVVLGFPIVCAIYLIATFAPEIGKGLMIASPLTAAQGVIFCYIGISLGDFLFGGLSQYFRSRKKSALLSIIGTFLVVCFGFFSPPQSSFDYYLFAGILGFITANWALILSIAAESFGTNIRATVTTSVPNVIRGSAALFVFLFAEGKIFLDPWNSALCATLFAVICSSIALFAVEETFGRNLSFTEDD
jgi:putative MFS transporter